MRRAFILLTCQKIYYLREKFCERKFSFKLALGHNENVSKGKLENWTVCQIVGISMKCGAADNRMFIYWQTK